MPEFLAPIPPVTAADLHRFAPPGAGTDAPSPVAALRAACAALPDGGARFVFELTGQMAALRVLDQNAPDAWPLWRHTCFEVFLSVPGAARYREYNFSPAGLWAGYAFRRYREMERELTDDGAPPPVIQTERRSDAVRLAAGLPAALLPDMPFHGTTALRVGLSAVVEHGEGQIEYWALHHPVAGRADFHHPDGWTLHLDAWRKQA
jgi:hypothetical protein